MSMIRLNTVKHYTGKFAERPATLPYGDTYFSTDDRRYFVYDENNLPREVSTGSSDEIAESTKEDIQGYYSVISNYYAGDQATRDLNPVVELDEDVWTKLEIMPLVEFDESPDSQKELGIFNAADNRFSMAGLDDGSNIIMRTLVRLRPDVDEGAASLRLKFQTNEATAATGFNEFVIESQLFNMTQGADVDYQDESVITAFVGSTLSGDTIANAGSFVVEINSTVDADLEVLAFTLYINK